MLNLLKKKNTQYLHQVLQRSKDWKVIKKNPPLFILVLACGKPHTQTCSISEISQLSERETPISDLPVQQLHKRWDGYRS